MLSVLQIDTHPPLLPVMCLGCHPRVTYSHRQNKTGIIYSFPFFLFHIIVKPHRFSLVWLHQPSLPPTLSHPLMLETPRVLSSLAAATRTHPTFNPRFGPLRKWSLSLAPAFVCPPSPSMSRVLFNPGVTRKCHNIHNCHHFVSLSVSWDEATVILFMGLSPGDLPLSRSPSLMVF